jgi:hypothetical protein
MISFITNVARVRTAQVGLAVKRYQLRNGNFPASLEALAPEFLQEETLSDPFDGKSLRWAVLVDRYVVYSIGDPRLNERAKSYDVAALSSVTFTVAK